MLGGTDPSYQNQVSENPFKSSAIGVNITSFNHQLGLYYESHGQTILSHLKWDLVAYVDLSTQYS